MHCVRRLNVSWVVGKPGTFQSLRRHCPLLSESRSSRAGVSPYTGTGQPHKEHVAGAVARHTRKPALESGIKGQTLMGIVAWPPGIDRGSPLWQVNPHRLSISY